MDEKKEMYIKITAAQIYAGTLTAAQFRSHTNLQVAGVETVCVVCRLQAARSLKQDFPERYFIYGIHNPYDSASKRSEESSDAKRPGNRKRAFAYSSRSAKPSVY